MSSSDYPRHLAAGVDAAHNFFTHDGKPKYHLVIAPEPSLWHRYEQIVEKRLPGDTGFNLISRPCAIGADGSSTLTYTGIRARAIHVESGRFVGYQIRPRSSVGKSPLCVTNSPGTVDAGYTGEVRVLLHSRRLGDPYNIMDGIDEFAQIVVSDKSATQVILVQPGDELYNYCFADETERGSRGFGSTGNSA